MKVLCISDSEQTELWDHWPAASGRLEGVQLILSAGDLKGEYLEFLVSVLNVPCLYVKGNHDDIFDTDPPQGCACIEDMAVWVHEDSSGLVSVKDEDALFGSDPAAGQGMLSLIKSLFRRYSFSKGGGEKGRLFMIAGLGGSMRYREGRNMYTEKEMSRRVKKLERRLRAGGMPCGSDITGILLTHAPCAGYGDMKDLPHRGFACFSELLEHWKPACHLYGHVHMEYGNFVREAIHPSGTDLINVSGMYILDI